MVATRCFFLFGDSSLTPHEGVCCGVISYGQGIRRFCMLTLEEGEKTSRISSHLVNAKLVGNSFFFKTKIKGGSGALSAKTLCTVDMRAEDISYFMDKCHASLDWESKFDQAKFLKYSGRPTITPVLKSSNTSTLATSEEVEVKLKVNYDKKVNGLRRPLR
jgi:hypothetical protein